MGYLKRRIIEAMEPTEEPPMDARETLFAAVYGGGEDAVKALREYLETREGVADAITKQRWIPVSERLPDRGFPVIGWFPGAVQSFECSRNESDGVWCNSDTGIHMYEEERPTHWMPLPEPPEVK